MADENPTGKRAAEPSQSEAQDLHDQAIVLAQVLTSWPTHLRVSDLLREIVNDPRDFAERDKVERAVRDLGAAGLVFRCESVVLPTRAALHFNRLPVE
jgi:hypothetical protein